ncbi:MAG: hypothetical protein IJM79_03125 [Erysipelotrichaceae bacterium]|nr:hypothetical protein [Erysipelotrichaceae bacterium]
MEYEEILDQIIELRDAIYENVENDQIFKVKPQLDQIRELAEQMQDEDDTRRIIDKISVFDFLMELYGHTGRQRLSNECCYRCIELSRRLMDQDNRVYEPARDYYRSYIANRLLLDGDTSEDLEDELYQYFNQEGLDLRETTLEYFATAPRHDPVEDSEEYLNVIDAVSEKLYEALEEHKEEEDFPERYIQLKKKILKEDYGIDWKSPQEYNEENQ